MVEEGKVLKKVIEAQKGRDFKQANPQIQAPKPQQKTG